MTPGWAELLAWMQQQSADGVLDAEVAWDAFRAVVATSEQVALPELCVRFHAAPARDRMALAGTIASLLAPVEWPVTWRDARLRLVKALDALVLETAVDSISFDLTLDERDLYSGGWMDLTLARDLLRIPCRRDELRSVAKLCDMGNFARWRAFGRALTRLGHTSQGDPATATRRRFAVAFGVYVEAARTMNEACGRVMFAGLDFTFGDSEAL